MITVTLNITICNSEKVLSELNQDFHETRNLGLSEVEADRVGLWELCQSAKVKQQTTNVGVGEPYQKTLRFQLISCLN